MTQLLLLHGALPDSHANERSLVFFLRCIVLLSSLHSLAVMGWAVYVAWLARIEHDTLLDKFGVSDIMLSGNKLNCL